MIYVTHDQVEAMTMADKIVVLNAGKIEQVGSPLELYDTPGQPLRRRLHRLAEDELRHRRSTSPDSSARPRSASGRSTSRSAATAQGWPGTVAVAEHLGSDTFFYVECRTSARITVARPSGELGLRDRRPGPARCQIRPRIHRFDATAMRQRLTQ